MKKADSDKKKLYLIMGSILLLAIVCHWPILTFDGFMWDDVEFWKAQQTHDYQHLIDSFTAMGKPHGMLLPYLIFLNFDYQFIFMRLSLLSAQYAISLLVFLFFTTCLQIERKLAIIVAIISLIWPAMLISHMLIEVGALFLFVCFLIGCYSYTNWLFSKPLKYIWLIISLVSWGISFTLSSMLVYIFGFWFCAVIYFLCAKINLMKVWKSSKEKVLIHVSLLIYPVGFYFVEKKLFPLHAYYGGGQEASGHYNKPVFEITKILSDFWPAIKNSVISPFINIGQLSPWFLFFALFSGVFVGLILQKRLKPMASSGRNEVLNSLGTPLFLTTSGLIMLFCGLFPYVAVGKPPGIIGVTTRHAILVALPMGLVIAGIYGYLTSIKKRWVTFAANATIVFLVLCFIAIHFRNYVDWQICSLKDKAVIEALKRERPLKDVDLYIIRGQNLEGVYDRRWYDWGFIMSQAWGGFAKLAVPEYRYNIANSPRKYPLGGSRDGIESVMYWMGFGSPDSSDAIGLIEITPNDVDIAKMNKYEVFWADLKHRFGFANKSRSQWLDQFFTASISLHTYPSPYNKKNPVIYPLTRIIESIAGSSKEAKVALAQGIKIIPTAIKEYKVLLDPDDQDSFVIKATKLPTGRLAKIELKFELDFRNLVNLEQPAFFWVEADVETPSEERDVLLVVIQGCSDKVSGKIVYKEYYGVKRSSDARTIETWVDLRPDCAYRTYLIWQPQNEGQELVVNSIHYGTSHKSTPPWNKGK
jgi:hypothetical protein